MRGLDSFLWGCAGAVLPEVLRFFKLVANGGRLPQLEWGAYLVLFLLYILTAGLVAVAFKPDSAWKGLWVGASLPALVATLVQVAPLPK